jgi:hypothetical protein
LFINARQGEVAATGSLKTFPWLISQAYALTNNALLAHQGGSIKGQFRRNSHEIAPFCTKIRMQHACRKSRCYFTIDVPGDVHCQTHGDPAHGRSVLSQLQASEHDKFAAHLYRARRAEYHERDALAYARRSSRQTTYSHIGKTILVLNPRRLETFMREFLGEALEQVPRIIESCCLGLGAFQLLARPEKFEVNLRAGNAPFEQIMINAHHKRFWPAEVIVRVAFWQHIFE